MLTLPNTIRKRMCTICLGSLKLIPYISSLISKTVLICESGSKQIFVEYLLGVYAVLELCINVISRIE